MGRLFAGYDPRMEAVHRFLAGRLARIVEQHGWPGRSTVGADGAAAAWRVAHHAIATPALQRRFLALVQAAAARGEATPLQAAMLEDRVRHLEGRPSLYATLLDWDEQGRLSPGPVEAAAELDSRRAALGLPPLAAALASANAGPARAWRRCRRPISRPVGGTSRPGPAGSGGGPADVGRRTSGFDRGSAGASGRPTS